MVIDITVKWDNREEFILRIQNLDEPIQMGLMNCIQNNELLLKLVKEQSLQDESSGKDSSLHQFLTFNHRSSDTLSQNWSFSNIEKLNLNLSFNGGNSYLNQSSVEDDCKFAFETKSYEHLLQRVQNLERENKIYKNTQNELVSQ